MKRRKRQKIRFLLLYVIVVWRQTGHATKNAQRKLRRKTHASYCRETTHSILKKSVKTKRVFLPKGKKIHPFLGQIYLSCFASIIIYQFLQFVNMFPKTAHKMRTAEDVGPYNFLRFSEKRRKRCKIAPSEPEGVHRYSER